MSVIADVAIPAEEFALGHLLEVRPGVRVRLESMIPTGETVIPYFWVHDPDSEAVEAALRESPLVEEVHVLDEVAGETLFRVEWAANIDGMIEAVADHDAVVLDGEGHGDHWTFQLRFPEYDPLSEFYRDVVNKGISIDLERIHNPITTDSRQGVELSPPAARGACDGPRRGVFCGAQGDDDGRTGRETRDFRRGCLPAHPPWADHATLGDTHPGPRAVTPHRPTTPRQVSPVTGPCAGGTGDTRVLICKTLRQ